MDISAREKQNLERIYPFLGDCTLFLARDHSFPLAKPCSIAAYGRGVRHTVKGGTGSGDVNSRFFITIEEGLEKAGFKIVSKSWLDKADEIAASKRKDWIKEIKQEAKKIKMFPFIYALGHVMPEPEFDMALNYDADAAIYVVSRVSGEGADREIKKGDILLTDSEVRDILSLNKKYKNFMLVINAGGVVDLSPVLDVRNILILSELGAETGRVFADILLGNINPSGKLSDTWARIEDYPYDKNIPLDNTLYNEGVYVGYRYFDSFNVKPLFPFGYGLSYTSFKLDNFKVNHEKNKIRLSVEVKNTGHFKGKEVVQVYVSYLGKEETPYQELVGFSKTKEIQPEKSDVVDIDFTLNTISKYDGERELYYLPEGDYLVRVGNASNNTVEVAIFHLDEEVILKEARNIYEHVCLDLIHPEFIKEKHLNLNKINLNQMDFELISYKEEDINVPEKIKEIPLEHLISMNAGYIANQHSVAFVGESSTTAPGAAGEISSDFTRYTSRKVVMADGPAGVRLTRSYIKKGNKIKKLELNSFIKEAIDFIPGIFRFILRKLLLKEYKPDKNDKIYHQYCTALPIATALAQSFNKELAFMCGDIVGSEMEEYNIDLWLAPAMNIHRTIMCGRNFEYYSEDPYLTGTMASIVSRGVQSHPNKGVVIKHFAANNQETFRYVSNSVVDEKTLREIYLRGFEICIHEASPKGIMSSYNLVNNEHTSESIPLLHDYLYNENSYKGVIMTDWIMRGSKPRLAKYDISHIEKVYKASTSLFMPGSKYDIKCLTKELKKHPENRIYLEKNTTRLFKNFSQ